MNIPNAADLVEASLRALDESEVSEADFRGCARALYRFQDQYESRPTFFRVMGLLERRNYFATVPMEEHPDFEEHEDHFESSDTSAIEPVFRHPSQEWSEEDNPIVGFSHEGELYLESGTELWREVVDAGTLEGPAAEEPEALSLFDAVAQVVELADRNDDIDLVLRWYAALGFHLGMNVDADLDQLEDEPGLHRIRRAVGGIDDLEMKLAHPKRDLDVPPPPLREQHPVLGWWYDIL